MKKDNKKTVYIDDGRTIADMNVDGMKGYVPNKVKEHNKELADLGLTRGEKWAIIKGALSVMMPIVGLFAAMLLVLYYIMYLWLT